MVDLLMGKNQVYPMMMMQPELEFRLVRGIISALHAMIICRCGIQLSQKPSVVVVVVVVANLPL